eukprot:521200-Pyramimonas_sp.AAC.1
MTKGFGGVKNPGLCQVHGTGQLQQWKYQSEIPKFGGALPREAGSATAPDHADSNTPHTRVLWLLCVS